MKFKFQVGNQKLTRALQIEKQLGHDGRKYQGKITLDGTLMECLRREITRNEPHQEPRKNLLGKRNIDNKGFQHQRAKNLAYLGNRKRANKEDAWQGRVVGGKERKRIQIM